MGLSTPNNHELFVHALQHEPVPCGTAGCAGPVQCTDLSQAYDRIKTYQLRCERCGWANRITGNGSQDRSWDDAALLGLAEEHMLHQQPMCPFDHTPVVFTSLPNPRRKARYRLSCFYCGRQAEMDWPPPEARR